LLLYKQNVIASAQDACDTYAVFHEKNCVW
jgi:hypothetical protein